MKGENQMSYPIIENQDEKLRKICENNLKIKYKNIDTKIKKVLDCELESIKKLKITSIFLIMYETIKKLDIRKYQKMCKRAIGNSLVAYLCNISNIDPLEINLPLYLTYGIDDRLKKTILDISFTSDLYLAYIEEIKKKFNMNIYEKRGCSSYSHLIFIPDGNNKINDEELDYFLKTNYPNTIRELFYTQTVHKDSFLNCIDTLSNITCTDPLAISLKDEKILSFLNSTIIEAKDANNFYRIFTKKFFINDFDDYVKMLCIGHSSGIWDYIKDIKNLNLKNIVTNRDDLFLLFLKHGFSEYDAFVMAETIRKGMFNDEIKLKLTKAGIDGFTIELLSNIKYLFPKGEAYEKALKNWRLTWYQINYPNEFSKYINNNNYV